MSFEKISSYGWLDPRGVYHPHPKWESHEDMAVKHAPGETPNRAYATLMHGGWMRVLSSMDGHTLLANNEYLKTPPSYQQLQTLKNHAIEAGHRRIDWYGPMGHMRTMWTKQEDEGPDRLAARAPGGGMIVNNQFSPGGQFLPKIFLSIRQAIAMRKKIRGAASPSKLTRGDEVAPVKSTIAGLTETEKGLLRKAAETGVWTYLGDALQDRGTKEGEYLGRMLVHAHNEGVRPSVGDISRLPRHAYPEGLVGESFPSRGYVQGQWRSEIEHRLRIIDPETKRIHFFVFSHPADENPMQLSRSVITDVVSPADLNPTIPRRTFTDDEIRRIEDAHGLRPSERLKRTVHVKTGQVSAKIEDYARFIDAITKKRLGNKTHKILNDPHTPDEVKAVHLANHVRGEADSILSQIPRGEAAKWYGEHTDAWEAAMHHLLSRDIPGDPRSVHRPDHPGWGKFNPETGKVEGKKPFMRLAKGVLAFTSGNTTPSINAWAAFQMLKKAVETDPNNPFAHLPEVNHDQYRGWVDIARRHLPEGENFTKVTDATPEHMSEKHPKFLTDAWAWQQKYGEKLAQARIEPGYSAINIVKDRNSGQPIAIAPMRSGDSWKPFPGITVEQVLTLAKAKQLRPGVIPNPGPDGHLKPKSWGTLSNAIRASSQRLAKLVNDKGSEGAADWLEGTHPIEEVRKYHPNFSWGALPKSNKVPGSYIFGEKFGPFFQNLAGKDTYFTLDKHMARHAYRAFGALLDAKRGIAESGRSEADKRIIGDAFRKAADHLGIAVSDLQALIWDVEQTLPNLFGVSHERDNFKIGGQRILQRLGFSPSVAEAVGSPPSSNLPGPVVPGAQQVARRGFGKPRSPGKPKSARPRPRT